jgi:hypothetical protein
LFVETPRKFITASNKFTWCFHKQNYYILWCLWCLYSECISTPGKLEKYAWPILFTKAFCKSRLSCVEIEVYHNVRQMFSDMFYNMQEVLYLTYTGNSIFRFCCQEEKFSRHVQMGKYKIENSTMWESCTEQWDKVWRTFLRAANRKSASHFQLVHI